MLIIVSKQQLTHADGECADACQCVDDFLGGRWPASFIHAWRRVIPILARYHTAVGNQRTLQLDLIKYAPLNRLCYSEESALQNNDPGKSSTEWESP